MEGSSSPKLLARPQVVIYQLLLSCILVRLSATTGLGGARSTSWRRRDEASRRWCGARWKPPVNIALWVVAGLLAIVFLISGSAKLFVPKERLATVPLGGWTGDASVGFVKALGTFELMAAAGLILSAALDIAPVLVPLAAVGVVLLMVGAMITHLRRHEAAGVALNVFYLAMAVFVAWGRFGPESF